MEMNFGEPFDAFEVELFIHQSDLELFFLNDGCLVGHYHECENLQDLYLTHALVQFNIAQALNPAIPVSEAVLDAMKQVPEAMFWHVEGRVNTRLKWDDHLKTFTVNGETLTITDYVQADCPLALETLLQFTLDGERKETE